MMSYSPPISCRALLLLFWGLVSAAGQAPSMPLAPEWLRDYEFVELHGLDPGSGLAGKLTIEALGRTWELEVEPYDIRSDDYRAQVQTDWGPIELPAGAANTYKGSVVGESASQVRLARTEAGIQGYIRTPDEWIYIEPAARFGLYSRNGDHLAYRAADLLEPVQPAACGVQDRPLGGLIDDFEGLAQPRGAAFKQAQIATEADFEMFQDFGSAAAVNQHVLSVLVFVEGIYEQDVGITFKVVFQNVWATSADPYTTTEACGSVTPNLLAQFGSYWNANFAAVGRDLAHLWTGKDICVSTIPPPGNPCSVIGCAYTGVVCSFPSSSYGVSENFSSVLHNLVLVTAHEVGHNFDAVHHGETCPRSIMNAGLLSCSTNFSTASISEITAHAAAHSGCTPSLSPQRLAVGSARGATAGGRIRRFEPSSSP